MKQTLAIENLPPELYEGKSPRNGGLLPTKLGSVCLLQTHQGRPIKRRVRLSVYTGNFDRYAVVSQDKVMCKDCGYINLKNCTFKDTSNVNKGESQQWSFQILPRDCDGNVLTFVVGNQQELREWLAVFEADSAGTPSPLMGSVGQGPLGRRPLTPRSPNPRDKKPTMPILEEEGIEE